MNSYLEDMLNSEWHRTPYYGMNRPVYLIWEAGEDETGGGSSSEASSDYDGMDPVDLKDEAVLSHIVIAQNTYLKVIKLFNLEGMNTIQVQNYLDRMLEMKGKK